MAFQLYLKPHVRKKLDRLDIKERKRIVQILDSVISNPFLAKQLHGDRIGQFSKRVWPYRFIYRIDVAKHFIIIIEFGHRKNVYR